ncbi:MAG: hypothetical protein PHV34_05135 [Verrucomicrobiae bacterium]|nr:hypothetical protein [Verrucomicrobiae bacterium]
MKPCFKVKAFWGVVSFLVVEAFLFASGPVKPVGPDDALAGAKAPGHVNSLVRDIQPAVQAAMEKPGDALGNTIEENAR